MERQAAAAVGDVWISVITKRVPAPGAELSVIEPPACSINERVTANPRP